MSPLSSAPDGNRVNDNCSNVPDKQEAVSSQGLEDTPKNKEDAEMTRDPAGFEDKQEAVSSQGLEDTPKNKEDAEMTRDPGFEESVLSQGLEDTPKNKEDAKMTGDPGFEDDDITDNRHDDDVEMGSQSSDKTDPVPDNNGEEDKWSEEESATGEGEGKEREKKAMMTRTMMVGVDHGDL